MNDESVEVEQIIETTTDEKGSDVASDFQPDGVNLDTASPLPTIAQLVVAVGILSLVLATPYAASLFKFKTKTAPVTEMIVEEPAISEAIKEDTNYFDKMAVGAEAVYVWDVSTQKALYTKNSQAQLPLASLTKLMTGIVAYETYGATAIVPITLAAITQEGENGFADGDAWDAKSLLDFTLMTSSNDGAYALAAAAGKALNRATNDPEKVFIDRMNAKAKELGLTQTYFTNPTGLDTSEAESGSYGSARDVAFLMEYIVQHAPEILETTDEKSSRFTDKKGSLFTGTNTNQEVDNFTNLLGSKTGYTVLAGGNLVVSFDAGLNHPIVIVVLGSSRDGRFSDVAELTKRTLLTVAQ